MSNETPIPQPPGGCKLHGRAGLPGRLVLELAGRFYVVSLAPGFPKQEDAWKFWEAQQQAEQQAIHLVDVEGAIIT